MPTEFRQSVTLTSSITVSVTPPPLLMLTQFGLVGSKSRSRHWADVQVANTCRTTPKDWWVGLGSWGDQQQGLLPYCSDHWTTLPFIQFRMSLRIAHVHGIARPPACWTSTRLPYKFFWAGRFYWVDICKRE